MNDIMAAPVSSPAAVLRGYFHAKDENRPFVLAGVFAPDVELQVVNRASSIEFPALPCAGAAVTLAEMRAAA